VQASDGSSSNSSRAGHQRPEIASICCSPPESVPRLLPALARSGKVHDVVKITADPFPVPAQVGTELQILEHAHLREDAAPFGTWTIPGNHLVGFIPRRTRPQSGSRRPGVQQPQMSSSGALAGTVAPDQRNDFPSRCAATRHAAPGSHVTAWTPAVQAWASSPR